MNQLKGVKNPGDHVYTTLDPQLQQAASDALGDRRGAVIAMEPDTGKFSLWYPNPDMIPIRWRQTGRRLPRGTVRRDAC